MARKRQKPSQEQSALDAAISTQQARQAPEPPKPPPNPEKYGYKADGTPRRSHAGPGRGHTKPKTDQNAKALDIPQQFAEVLEKPDEVGKYLKLLQKDLFRLGKKAIKRLNKLLDSSETKVLLQASSIATRSALLGLAKDTLGGSGGASIHIHASGSATVIQTERPPSVEDERSPHQRTGHPIMVTK